jgi:hypothetical protein
MEGTGIGLRNIRYAATGALRQAGLETAASAIDYGCNFLSNADWELAGATYKAAHNPKESYSYDEIPSICKEISDFRVSQVPEKARALAAEATGRGTVLAAEGALQGPVAPSQSGLLQRTGQRIQGALSVPERGILQEAAKAATASAEAAKEAAIAAQSISQLLDRDALGGAGGPDPSFQSMSLRQFTEAPALPNTRTDLERQRDAEQEKIDMYDLGYKVTIERSHMIGSKRIMYRYVNADGSLGQSFSRKDVYDTIQKLDVLHALKDTINELIPYGYLDVSVNNRKKILQIMDRGKRTPKIEEIKILEFLEKNGKSDLIAKIKEYDPEFGRLKHSGGTRKRGAHNQGTRKHKHIRKTRKHRK